MVSQKSLRPVIKNDTVRFTVPQAKVILKKLITGEYCDSISKQQDSLLSIKDTIISLNEKTIRTLKQRTNNDRVIIATKDEIITIKNEDLKKADKKVKLYKLGNRITIISAVILVITILVIYK